MSCYESNPALLARDARLRARHGDAYADLVRRNVEAFPPLTRDQLDRVIALLNPGSFSS